MSGILREPSSANLTKGIRASTIAAEFGLELDGADCVVRGVATLDQADSESLSFFANSKYRGALERSHAGVVIMRPEARSLSRASALFASDPYVAFAKIAAWLHPEPKPLAGIHATASVAPGAEIAGSAHIGAFCVIASSAVIAEGAVLGPHCIVGPDCVIGAGSHLVARVTLVKRVRLAERVLIHPGAVLGADGFGLAKDAGRWLKVPQLGGVVIGADVEIGANSTIDCGALGDTVLMEDVRIDNLVQIAHNVRVGAHSAMAGCVGVAGSANIGANVLVAGASGIAGHLNIADGTTVLAMSMVTSDIQTPGAYGSGVPLMEQRDWQRNMARLRNLDKLVQRVVQLEKQLNSMAAVAPDAEKRSPEE
jgi:UDP-3-O-[3-hydroxymyristoyl] glucosamine N-acyltransferase